MVLLTFDVEEFDIAEEYGQTVDIDTKIRVSTEGLVKILALLDTYNIKATFFCTAFFAEKQPELARRLAEQHELASHGYYHSDFKIAHLRESREALERIGGKPVLGYRMARLAPLDANLVAEAGYLYDSSMNPTWLPGRYNNLHRPRTLHRIANDKLWLLPTSVTPLLRFPLFWLTLKNLPLSIVSWLSWRTLQHDGYLSLYYHPWEFCDLSAWQLPYYTRSTDGDALLQKMENYIRFFKKRNVEFGTIRDFLARK